MFRALRYKNFRLFFIGQGISLIGTWMQQIAMGWLVYRMTNSAFILGFVGFSSQIPTFILSPFAGVLADKFNRQRMLILTQTLSMIQAFILAYLVLSGTIAVWHIIVLGTMLGCVNSLDVPVRQSFIIDMVERKELLGNAIALNSSMFNAARLVGPSLAGIIIALVGEGLCFLANGISFLAVIACLLAMKINYGSMKTKIPPILLGLKEGARYTFNFMPIRLIILLVGITSLIGMSYVILMPVVAKDILRGGPQTLGFLMAAVGVGALIGTLHLASRKSVSKLINIIPLTSAIFGIGLVAFSFSRTLRLSLPLLLASGFGFMVQMASCNTVVQTIVDDDKRGRVMSFYNMAFMGMAPVGSLIMGMLANKIGAAHTIAVCGISCVIVSMIFASKLPLLKKMVHPIYERIGVVSTAASGIIEVAELPLPAEDQSEVRRYEKNHERP